MGEVSVVEMIRAEKYIESLKTGPFFYNFILILKFLPYFNVCIILSRNLSFCAGAGCVKQEGYYRSKVLCKATAESRDGHGSCLDIVWGKLCHLYRQIVDSKILKTHSIAKDSNSMVLKL